MDVFEVEEESNYESELINSSSSTSNNKHRLMMINSDHSSDDSIDSTASSSSSNAGGGGDSADNWSIFPLTDNLSNSYVDESKLISFMSENQKFPIGMANFKSTKRLQQQNQLQQLQAKTQFPFPGNQAGSAGQMSLARLRWKTAASKVRQLNDPWADFKIELYEAEHVVRHRYNAIKKAWIQDECVVKIEPNQFAHGAMRACFRLKKLSHFVHKASWEHAGNYVAKSYMDPTIPRQRYFDDAKLQMDAKLWAEIFNRHNPPKKIDMFQVSILEFKNRPDSPLFHLEHFLDGKYVKYNSNSGFVDDEHVRLTPQAFSHFTFECSNHEIMVVDIQGVGDLYTDPQIHTANGKDYGDGNLGTKGFALFFYSHICNDVCKSLGLTQFDLAENEVKNHEKIVTTMQKYSLTICRGLEEHVIGSPTSFGEYFRMHRRRCLSSTSACSDDIHNELREVDESEGYESSSPSPLSPAIQPQTSATNPLRIPSRRNSQSPTLSSNPIPISNGSIGGSSGLAMSLEKKGTRRRNESCCLDSAFSQDEAVNYFQALESQRKPRASCVFAEKDFILNQLRQRNNNQQVDERDEDEDEDDEDEDEDDERRPTLKAGGGSGEDEGESILGKIHLDMCKYHIMGRFSENENDEIDEKAAFFHLQQAANLGVIEALTNMAAIYLDLPHDILSNYQVEEKDDNVNTGFEYLLEAANKGDKNSIFQVAKAFDTGANLSKKLSVNWAKAVEYYESLLTISEVDSDDEEEGEESGSQEDAGYSDAANAAILSDIDPEYLIMARLAELYKQGGNQLQSSLPKAISYFNRAAENAMVCAKGRLANKYYMLAEEISSEMD